MVHRCSLCVASWFVLLASLAAQSGTHAVRLRVLDHQGGPVQHCSVALLRVFDGPTVRYGKVVEVAERVLAPKDFAGDYATFEIPVKGRFVLRVGAELYAHTLSAPFDVPADTPPEVAVRLLRGAVLEGQVTDPDGKPVAGAEVSTSEANAPAADSPFGKVFAQLLPDLVTKARVTTDAGGKFRFERLSLGDYRLAVVHDDYCEGACTWQVAEEKAGTVPPIALQRGCVVEGAVTLDGVPAAGIRVGITSVAEVADGKAVPLAALPKSYEAVTDERGRYAFRRRLAPGAWQMHAVRAPAPGQQPNPFDKILAIQKSQRPVVVRDGEARQTQDFVLSSR